MLIVFGVLVCLVRFSSVFFLVFSVGFCFLGTCFCLFHEEGVGRVFDKLESCLEGKG